MEPVRPGASALIATLRAVALRGLARMYRAEERQFVFRARRAGLGVRLEGRSPRYTAIALIGLAGESEWDVREILQGDRPADVCGQLLSDVPWVLNLGDVALTTWAACAVAHPRRETALRRLLTLLEERGRCETVALAWAVSALCAAGASPVAEQNRARWARRLCAALDERSGLFPHEAGAAGSRWRGHVACFADQVYPILAVAQYAKLTADVRALEAANRCAQRICAIMGRAGQWWWHYDVRTGRVIEGYPVYAVHQDGMAPMALLGLHEAGGADHRAEIERGLAWLHGAPELAGQSLIDERAGMIWRKVARREPRKLVRRAQAVASYLHPKLRLPGMDFLFPPGVIDDECRPYHLGWLLYAWSRERVLA